jgi:hypothetical protein
MNRRLGQALHEPNDTILFPSWSIFSSKGSIDVLFPTEIAQS